MSFIVCFRMEEGANQVIKRSRGANFGLNVSNFKHVIENKQTDGVTVREKELAWQSVCEEYNACTATKRTWTQLKSCYENVKKKTKSA